MFGEFLTALITGKDCDNQMSSNQTKLKHLVAQNIAYIVSNNKVKAPKRLLYPSIIKAPISQNAQTHLNNSSANCKLQIADELQITDELFECV